MDNISFNPGHGLPISFTPPLIPTFELDTRISLIQARVNKSLKGWPSLTRTRDGKKVLTEIVKSGKLWVFVEGDRDYCVPNDAFMDSGQEEEEWQLPTQDVDTVTQILESDDASLQRAAQTTPAMRIGMIFWLVMMSSSVQDYRPRERGSAWNKWDLQGRAITFWADNYSKLMRSNERPSEAIPIDVDALAAFQSAMDDAGHQHDYQATLEVGTWATMRAALFPELKGSELACWHFNDDDSCSLCDERFRQKIHSETGLGHLPPLYLVTLWQYFHGCEDFEEVIAFAVFQRPHLFLPEIVNPIEELLAKRWPEKDRRTYGLRSRLLDHDPLVDIDTNLNPPSWQKIEDMINSLARFAPKRGRDRSPPIEPIFWFDVVRVLGGHHEFQDKGEEASWRPRVSLAAAHDLDNEVFGERLPLSFLNLNLLPEYVQRAVKRFCQATEHDAHTCCDDPDWIGPWSDLDVECRTRYAAAYALLYSTDLVPLFGDDNDDCDACDDIRALYDCVDEISAGQITLGSQNIVKVFAVIERLAVISDDCKFIFPDAGSDGEDDSESQRLYEQQCGVNLCGEEVTHEQTHESAMGAESERNNFDATIFSEFEASNLGWQEPSSAAQNYEDLTGEGLLAEYTTMFEGHATAQTHVREFTNLWDPPRGDSGSPPSGAAIPDSSLGVSYVAPEATWLTKQSIATSNVAGPSQPRVNIEPKISKAAKIRELHAFFVTLFKKHGVPLGTTGMAEARLPWKKMTHILAEQGLEVSGWPEGVPQPRSDGKADKGISGFNTKHIAALYQAMKADQIEFRPLAGGSPTSDVSRVRQREDDMEDKLDIRPTKKEKLAQTKKKPRDFVAMKSVMKL